MFSDPVYLLSSETDHARATLEANTSAQKLVSVCLSHCVCLFIMRDFRLCSRYNSFVI